MINELGGRHSRSKSLLDSTLRVKEKGGRGMNDRHCFIKSKKKNRNEEEIALP